MFLRAGWGALGVLLFLGFWSLLRNFLLSCFTLELLGWLLLDGLLIWLLRLLLLLLILDLNGIDFGSCEHLGELFLSFLVLMVTLVALFFSDLLLLSKFLLKLVIDFLDNLQLLESFLVEFLSVLAFFRQLFGLLLELLLFLVNFLLAVL